LVGYLFREKQERIHIQTIKNKHTITLLTLLVRLGKARVANIAATKGLNSGMQV